MKKTDVTTEQIAFFERYLRQEERSAATIEKYLREIGKFSMWLGGRELSKDLVAQWKSKSEAKRS